MKVCVIFLFWALAGYAAGGSISWPGALTVKTLIPGETKTTGYSTTQYINTLPSSYSFGAQPHFAYQVPQLNSYSPFPTGYYSIASPSYIPATNILYPAQPALIPASLSPTIIGSHIIPGIPNAPSLSNPISSNPAPPVESQPQPAGDSDSAVIDSADFTAQQQMQQAPGQFSSTSQSGIAQAAQQATSQFPSNSFSNNPSLPSASRFPQIPQMPQQPEQTAGFPINPQESQLPSFPSTPQIPQNQFPQITQSPQAPSFPQYPQFPQQPGFPQNIFSQGPSASPPSSFPGAVNNDSVGLNDEDTISVESA